MQIVQDCTRLQSPPMCSRAQCGRPTGTEFARILPKAGVLLADDLFRTCIQVGTRGTNGSPEIRHPCRIRRGRSLPVPRVLWRSTVEFPMVRAGCRYTLATGMW